MLYGPRGSGKTWLGLSIAYAAATGQSLLNWEGTNPVRTLYVDGEMPGASLQSRLALLVRSFGRTPDPGFFDLIACASQPGAMPDLARMNDREELGEIMSQYGLVILDNLSCLVRASAENEGDQWAPIADWAIRHRAEGRAISFVHHGGKSGDQRGTSRREDVLDAVLRVKPADDQPMVEGQGTRIRVDFTKHRHFYGDDARPFEAVLATTAAGLSWQRIDVEDGTDDRVLRIHRDGITGVREIAAEISVNPSTVSRSIKRLRSAGRIS